MSDKLIVATTENDLVAAPTTETEVVTESRLLDFTIVHGYLRGEHACPFELHATGCRDLRSKQAQNLFSFNLYASDREAAHAQGAEEAGVKTGDVWVQPCTLLKRMKAIGRA